MPKCLITGCTLLDDNQERWVHGDLYLVGGCYVFNACMTKGESAWQYRGAPADNTRILRVSGDFFERRGVIVVDSEVTALNKTARDYLGSAP